MLFDAQATLTSTSDLFTDLHCAEEDDAAFFVMPFIEGDPITMWCSDTNTHTHTHTHTHTFHAWLFRDRADGWVSEVFHSTDARRACRRGAIGSTMGAYPRDTGSNLVEGNGHFFPSYRPLYLSSFFDTHTHTHTHTHVHAYRLFPLWWKGQNGAVFFFVCFLFFSIMLTSISCVTCHSSRVFIMWHTGTNTPWHKQTHTHTYTHTHTQSNHICTCVLALRLVSRSVCNDLTTPLLTFIVVLSYTISWGSIHSAFLWALCSPFSLPSISFSQVNSPGYYWLLQYSDI